MIEGLNMVSSETPTMAQVKEKIWTSKAIRNSGQIGIMRQNSPVAFSNDMSFLMKDTII